MLPAEWRQVLEKIVRHRPTRSIELVLGGFEIGRVPEHDRARDQIERARAVALGLDAGIADTADAVEEDCAFERVFGLALVQLARDAASLIGCSIQSSVNRVRSTRPISLSASARPFARG